MPILRAIPRHQQRDEAWSNGAGTTTVILREPDDAGWRVRISVARVDREGPFSELPDTRRTLVPLDAPMTLRFRDGRQMHAARFESLHFEGSPAPEGLLPGGPTRDFNLMLRGGARGDICLRTLRGAAALNAQAGLRWLVYLHHGDATLRHGAAPDLRLQPGDAALVAAAAGAPEAVIDGTGEIILVKLYA